MKPSIFRVYQEFIWKEEHKELAEKLYDDPIRKMGSLVSRGKTILTKYKETKWFTQERVEGIQHVLTEINKEIGCLTPKVSDSITNLHQGAVESAHQTVVMGGPGYILNKAASAVSISTYCGDNGFPVTPYFCVADYDVVQSELTNIRTPNMGQSGNLVSIPVPEGYENSPVSHLPLPGFEWYSKIEESIRSSYRPFFKMLERTAHTLFAERLENCLTVTRDAFVNSTTLGEWATRILGKLFNIIGDLGIPLVPAGDVRLRKYICEGLEYLLQTKNREIFLKAHDEATRLITNNGYASGAGPRGRDYVPFLYECPNSGCNRSRTELNYQDVGNKAILEGKCIECGEQIQIEVDKDSPDLSEYAPYLSLRVDSRQLAIDTIIPTIAHVGGPGETAYYAQVIPAAKMMNEPFPLFMRYPRTYFNTPWTETLGKELKQKEIPVLHEGKLFKLSGKVNKFRRKEQFEKMNEAIFEFNAFIHQVHSQLNDTHEQKVQEIEQASGEKYDKLQMLKLDIEKYLSWTFGQYAPKKLGQESTWSWIEWALNSGFTDLFGAYHRAHSEGLKNGATLFVNFMV
ncbi:MAG: bacillithiol biosynthesis BshC [Candidatus Lokiarchaeota archaeon]|nr:bacillithiol biosynthesis BshC [Candidatus Lokiarchaeota archaeon]